MIEFCCKTEPPSDAARRFVGLVKDAEIEPLRQLLVAEPELPAQIDEPWFAFDAPAIVQAASQKNRDLIDLLLEFGADIKTRSQWWAGGFGVLDQGRELADFLIERGAVVDIHAAAGLGDLDRLRDLLGQDPELIHARGGDGQLPLHFAADGNTAGFLLNQGAEIDARDLDHRSTAAHYAVGERPEVCRLLVERGATADLLMAAALGDLTLAEKLLDEDPTWIEQRVGKRDFPGMNDPVKDAGHIYQWTLRGAKWPQQVAKAFDHPELWRLLMDRSPPTDALVMACWYGDDERLDRLRIERPNLATEVGEEGRALLVQAAWDGETAAVERFLDLGFDVDTFAGDGTALDRAAVRGRADVIELLLRHGASTAIKNAYGGSPAGAALWGAIHFRESTGNYPAAVRLLLEAQQPNTEARSAMLRFVASDGGLEMTRLLLQEGAAPELTDEEGRTALDLARASGHYTIVDLIARHTA